MEVFNIFRFGAPVGQITVWDCRGTVWLFSKEVEQNGDVIRVEHGYFSLQVPKSVWEKLNDEEKKILLEKLENWAFRVLEDDGGAINWSGVYYIYKYHFEKYLEILDRVLRRKKEPESLEGIAGVIG